MLSQRIQQHFIDSADLQYQCAQSLAAPVEAAIHALMGSVTSGGKVLACGLGGSAAAAQYFVTGFVGRFERERPELPALALNADASLLTGLAQGFEPRAVFARQVRALGQAGDLLLVLAAGGSGDVVVEAVAAAHEREMTVVAITGPRAGALGNALKDTDVLVSVPHERLARVQEVQLMTLHCLLDGVDAQLLGDSPEPENPT
jgi:D-sedoheptulose 7-phosphate isomerase